MTGIEYGQWMDECGTAGCVKAAVVRIAAYKVVMVMSNLLALV